MSTKSTPKRRWAPWYQPPSAEEMLEALEVEHYEQELKEPTDNKPLFDSVEDLKLDLVIGCTALDGL